MPRYYKDRLYNKDERKIVAYFTRADMLKREQELRNKYGDMFDYKKFKSALSAFITQKHVNNENQNKESI